MSIAIRAEHVSKEYRLGVINHGMLYKDFQSWVARRLGRPDPHGKIGEDHFQTTNDKFWALKDVSFDIKEGDRVGIIGKNGAGKSTLLKILARITAPTEGNIKIKGRVASLLEVGTGFHGELTGRENIYLNGAILGMKKREIDRKLEEIIDFSGIENHIDTPVKRYSSGMYVRLAFAVAAHLDSEILLADEVLAVGDAEFQKKALGKMQDLSMTQGRTVIFVSHQLTSVSTLCRSGILLNKGEIEYVNDDIGKVINQYIRPIQKDGNLSVWENEGEISNKYFIPNKLYLTNNSGTPISEIGRADENISIVLECNIEEASSLLNIGFTVLRQSGENIFSSWLRDISNDEENRPLVGYNKYKVELPNSLMNIGDYKIILHAGLHHQAFIISPESNVPTINFSIIGTIGSEFGDDSRGGAILPLIKWRKEN